MRGRKYSLRSFSHCREQGIFHDLAVLTIILHLPQGVPASHFSLMVKHLMQEPPLSRTAPAFSLALTDNGPHLTPVLCLVGCGEGVVGYVNAPAL